MSLGVLEALGAKFGDQIVSTHSACGDDTAVVKREAAVAVATFLKHDEAMSFEMPVDVTAVDYLEYPGHEGPRFEVVYHFYSLTHGHRIRLKFQLDADDAKMPSLQPVWRGCDWFERETFDMYGIVFEGHPDLRRLLLYPEFEGYPLRKDYPLRGYQPLVPVARLDRDNEDPKLMDTDFNPEAPDAR